MTDTTYTEHHVVLAMTAQNETVTVSDHLDWNAAQTEWRKLDDLRLAGKTPHVKFYMVRSTDDPKALSRLSLVHRRVVTGRGFLTQEAAARRAWKLFAPTFRSWYDKRGDDKTVKTGVQGTGGWFYWPNGVTVAQGLRDLARITKKRGMIVGGADGKWYTIDLLAD